MSSTPSAPIVLEVPTDDDRVMWDILLYSNVLAAISAADELGLFTVLAETPLTVEEAAERLNLGRDWAEVLLATLGAMKLARVVDGRFQLTHAARAYMLPESPYYRGFSLRSFVKSDPGERIKHSLSTTGNPNSGRYVVREWKPGDLTLEDAKRSTATMHGLSIAAAAGMARNADFDGVTRLLDVGGGSGGFAIAISQRHPHIRCTVADLDVVCEVTREYIERFGVADRVDTLTMNMFYEEFPRGYDAILFSLVLHDWGHEQREHLIHQAFKALPSGGKIYIHEMLMNDSGDGPVGPALYALMMRIGTGGKQFTAPELRRDLQAVGFDEVSVQNTFGDFSVVIGSKP